MIPVTLSISGFLSYKDPVEIDFTGFDLACISGQNGAGKSSILDAVTWALFGRARKHDESIINLSSDAAQVNFTFEYEGNLYRAVRTNPRGKTSTAEFHIRENGTAAAGAWRPLTESSVRETDQKIADTLRLDYETFINAAFFLQGEADQFTQCNPSERKQILSQILNLVVWEEFRKKTIRKRRESEEGISRLEGQATVIRAELDEEADRRAVLADLEKELAESEEVRKGQEKELDEIRAYHQNLAEKANIAEELDLKIEESDRSLTGLREKLVPRTVEQNAYREMIDHEEQIRADFSSWENEKEFLSRMDETARAYQDEEISRLELLSEITRERARLEQEATSLEREKTRLDQALEKLPLLRKKLSAEEQEAGQAEDELDSRKEKQNQLAEVQAKLADAKAENPRLHQEMKDLQKRIEELEVSGAADCPLCGQPLAEEKRELLISDLKSQGKGLGNRYRENKKTLSASEELEKQLQQEIGNLGQIEQDLRVISRKQERLTLEIFQLENEEKTWVQNGAKRLGKIRSQLETKEFAREAHQKLAAIDKKLAKWGYDPREHDQVRQSVKDGEENRVLLGELEKAKAALAPLEREITDLADAIESARREHDAYLQDQKGIQEWIDNLAANAPDLKGAEQKLLDLKEREMILQRQLGAAQQKVSILETQKERLSNLHQKLGSHREDVRLLKQLELAFGKNGVPALLIEQALPQIELKANEILGRLSGGAMSVQFITQREYADKKRMDLKETLDIQIADREGVRDYEMYSGGESFRINFAIRLALSHILAQRAGARLQTLVIDEGFGSQDEIGRQRLTEAITLVKDDYKKILVITHLDQLKDAFSTQLVVEKTSSGSTVNIT